MKFKRNRILEKLESIEENQEVILKELQNNYKRLSDTMWENLELKSNLSALDFKYNKLKKESKAKDKMLESLAGQLATYEEAKHEKKSR